MGAVDRSRWQECLIPYARVHRCWLARLEGRRAHTALAPLMSIEIEGGDVVVQLGSERYRLKDPQRIVELTSDEGDRGLRIELADRTVFLRFRVAARPEMIGDLLSPQSPNG
jgi:hypothetical protein